MEAEVPRSGKDLSYFEEATKEAFCAATSSKRRAGAIARRWRSCARRITRRKLKGEQRVVLRLHPRVAPYKAAIFPLRE